MKLLTAQLYNRLLAPRSSDEDMQRSEFIFALLQLGLLAITGSSMLSMIANEAVQGKAYNGLPPLSLAPVVLGLAAVYIASRRKYRSAYVYIFIGMFALLATYGLYAYGYALPSSLLIYALIIVMAGILISSRAAITYALIVVLAMASIATLQSLGKIHPDLQDTYNPFDSTDAVLYSIIFGTILLVSWLSSRDIERSLRRARQSEAALKIERSSLERKVRERTRELERLQVEKTLQLHRFAEFGRQSSTLLHELANPLTSVSLELEQLDASEVVTQAQKGIAYMEQYVEAARRQLREQSDLTVFDCAAEIDRVISYLKPKAARQRIQITSKLAPWTMVYGDTIRFDQIVANLLTNAIDASEDTKIPIRITSTIRKHHVIILVEDHGVGIKRAELKKVFEPFYTTKPIEKGTGIGLSIVMRSVTEHFKGTISVTSSKKTGTIFKVVLPHYES